MDHANIQLINIDDKETKFHSELECILVIKGSIKIIINDNVYLLNQDDLIVINRNTIYSIEGNSSNVILKLSIAHEFKEKLLGSLADYEIDCILIGDNTDDKYSHEIKSLLGKILVDYINKQEDYKLNFNMNLVRLLYLLYMYYRGNKNAEHKTVDNDENSVILNVVKYINENYKSPLSLKMLAEREYISPTYLSTDFKRKTGVGFLEYVQALRIESAIKDLMNTNDSILKIALQNGFSNEKSFSNIFKKKYNQTPGQYRSKFKNEKEEKIIEKPRELFDIAAKDSKVLEFLKYIKRYELFEVIEDNQNTNEYTIDINNKIEPLSYKENFIILKDMKDIFDPDNRNNLLHLQTKLGMNIVYFPLEYKDIIVNNENFDNYYDLYRALEFLESNGFTPFISISEKVEFKNFTLEELEKNIISYLSPIFKSMDQFFSQKYISTWMYEIIPLKESSPEQSLCFYTTVYDCIKTYSHKSQVGMFSIDELAYENIDKFTKIITDIKTVEKLPDFLTFNAFANINKSKPSFEDMLYPDLKNLYNNIVKEISNICFKSCGKEIPMCMTVWSTITSSVGMADNSYFRTALILDSILNLSNTVKWIGFWLDTSMCSIEDGKIVISMLALYVFKKASRPAYNMLEVLKRLGRNLIYFDNNCLAAINEQEELIILLWNDIYLNPVYSMETKITEPHGKNTKVIIKNLKNKSYYIKRFTYNYSNSGIMGKSMGAGFPNDWKDKDVFEFLTTSAGKDLHITEQILDENLNIVLNSNIDFNGVVMYITSLR